MSDATSSDRSGAPSTTSETRRDVAPAAPPGDGQSAPTTPAPKRPRPSKKKWILFAVVVVVVLILAIVLTPKIITAFNTISTDDAYVNGHVTFVAPRVSGQVAKVLVDDNYRVKRGDLLVQLDPEPYRVALNIAQAAVDVANSDLAAAQAEVRAAAGKARAARFSLEHAVEDVDNQIALLRAKVATLQSQRATLARAQADYQRAEPLVKSGAIGQEELDRRKQAMQVAQAQVDEALQNVYQVRVSLGLPPKPPTGEDLTQVPADLDETFSSVREAQYALMQAASVLGVSQPFNVSPKQMIAEFYKRDPSGDIDKIYDELFKTAPGIKQAEAKLVAAQRNLDQAQLNLRYCDVVADIDGVVTRRSVNPGNNVQAGQSLMAIRSVREIWIDANFKETQLADLRIGQPVRVEVDMYGSKKEFNGRISGFTMGTGQTLSLLPPQNATGNFVKIVQRLPVRIELTDYDPDKTPLFIGLSVTPRVYYKEQPTGPNAGQVLQPLANVPTSQPEPTQ